MDEQTFRQELPEFADQSLWLGSTINRYINLGKKMMPADRWDDLLDEGLLLFAAHYLVLAKRATESALAGMAGEVVGLEVAKAVDKVSVSMDVSNVTFANAGHWNQTTYGVQYWQLSQMFGAGGIQL